MYMCMHGVHVRVHPGPLVVHPVELDARQARDAPRLVGEQRPPEGGVGRQSDAAVDWRRAVPAALDDEVVLAPILRRVGRIGGEEARVRHARTLLHLCQLARVRRLRRCGGRIGRLLRSGRLQSRLLRFRKPEDHTGVLNLRVAADRR